MLHGKPGISPTPWWLHASSLLRGVAGGERLAGLTGTPSLWMLMFAFRQVKRDIGWDSDSSLMIQTNPPEGPAVLHVTCELGEHVSGKYWLVEGTTLSKTCYTCLTALSPSFPR